jgi:hypothetical protein
VEIKVSHLIKGGMFSGLGLGFLIMLVVGNCKTSLRVVINRDSKEQHMRSRKR